MRDLVLAGLMFALGLLVVSLDAEEHTYIPVVRLRTGDGFFIRGPRERRRGAPSASCVLPTAGPAPEDPAR